MTVLQPPLGLDFPRRRAMGRDDFVVGPANAAALALLDGPAAWPEGRLALSGPAGSGKTHLVHVFMAATGAARVQADALSADVVPALVGAGAVALEDLDRSPGAEHAAFHLLNLARAERVPVLLTGRTPPAHWPVALPDLASRLAPAAVARLHLPDDALLAAVIAKLLADRHLRHEDGLPAMLATRIERSFDAARAAVERLDTVSLAERRNLTRRLVADLFPPGDAGQDILPLDPA
jgi:chromosomal replication initiation ATPase DnaA